nr:MAG TPA: hypothetical protein [Bacteriophage sp.]
MLLKKATLKLNLIFSYSNYFCFVLLIRRNDISISCKESVFFLLLQLKKA